MATNPTQGFGLVPVRRKNGPGQPVPLPQLYLIPSSVTVPIYIGDPMILTGADKSVTLYVAGGATGLIGVVAEVFDVNKHPLPDPNSTTSSLAATGSTVRYCTLYGDDNIFEAREDSVGGSLAITAIGENCELIGVASNVGNATENTSGWLVDSSGHATTSTHPVRIIGFSALSRENDPATANKVIEVAILPEGAV